MQHLLRANVAFLLDLTELATPVEMQCLRCNTHATEGFAQKPRNWHPLSLTNTHEHLRRVTTTLCPGQSNSQPRRKQTPRRAAGNRGGYSPAGGTSSRLTTEGHDHIYIQI